MRTIILIVILFVLLVCAVFLGVMLVGGGDPTSLITGGNEQQEEDGDNGEGLRDTEAGDGGANGADIPQLQDNGGQPGAGGDSSNPSDSSVTDPEINIDGSISDNISADSLEVGNTATGQDQNLPETDLISDSADRILVAIALIVTAIVTIKLKLIPRTILPAAKYPSLDTFNIDSTNEADRRKLMYTLEYIQETTARKSS